MSAPVSPGAEAWSHTASAETPEARHGVLVVHGFTGNPSSMRALAEAFAGAGFHVQLPRLPGHGTTVEEMIATRWGDWLGEAEAVLARLAGRAERIVVAGLSMGGALALRLAADHPELAGLVCVNPATQPQAPEVVAMLQGMLDEGTDRMPAIGSDIADPEARESAYEATPLAPLLSLVQDGLAPLQDRYPAMQVPLLLLTSPQDHVVDPAQGDFLAATYGGPVERVSLERSYHVATQDFDKDLIVERAVAFARRVTTS